MHDVFHSSLLMEHAEFPTAADIKAAAKRIAPYVPRTPVFTSSALNEENDAEIYFKMENLMPDLGSFKIRGALNAVLSMTDEERARGVMTQSSGNHGAALAKAASIVGVPCHVVVPSNAPYIKKKIMQDFGAVLHECGTAEQDRKNAAVALQEQTGMAMVHPFNDLRVIAGQATATRELLRQAPKLDAIFAPVGGGGLISGTALAAHYSSPKTNIYGGEPTGADDAYRSLQTGELQANESAHTVADALRSSLGEKTFPIIKAFVNHIVRVGDRKILRATRHLWQHLRTVVEPSSALSYAAFSSVKKRLIGKRIGIIISGGNVDHQHMNDLLWGEK